MSLSPDHSQFTAAALGESTVCAPSDFEAALEHHPGFRDEAEAIRATAHRLSTALKLEPSPGLTVSQRHAVLHPAPAAAPVSSGRHFRSWKPAWSSPVMATAGVAATFVLGVILWPEMDGGEPGNGGSSAGIPSVAIRPVVDAKTPPRPGLPLPQVGAPSFPEELPDAVLTETPADLSHSGPMAATPPAPVFLPAPPVQESTPLNEFAPPVKSPPGAQGPGEALASPAPVRP